MREIAVILIVTSLGLPMICGSESQTAVTLADESNRPRLIILADTQHELDGQSIRSLLVDPATEWPRVALTAYGENMFSVRSKRYRYIRYADGPEELYDHDADLPEWKNLAEFPETKAIRTELKAMLPATSARSPGGRDG